MAPKFSATDDEILIEEVRKYASLYDAEQKDYKDLSIRDSIWNKIALHVGKNSDDCKARWKNVRDNYLKHKKNPKMRTGSAATYRPKWPLFARLTFLDFVKSERRSYTSITNEDEADTQSINQTQPTLDEEDISCHDEKFSDASEPPSESPGTSRSSTPCSRTLRVKKKQNIMQAGMEERSKQRMELLQGICNQKENDEVDLFFKSIALKVKTLPPHLITELQMKVLSVVSDFQSRARFDIIIQQPSAELNKNIPEQTSLLEGYSLLSPGSAAGTDSQTVVLRL